MLLFSGFRGPDDKHNEKVKISSVDEGIIKIRNALCYRKVLLVLDDVDEPDLVEAIFDMKDWFGYGSKIIVTRHKSLLRPQLGLEVHEVEILYTVEANELFNFHAFGEKNPISEDYNYKEKEYSEEVIEWCRGLPLALQVIASSLAGKSKDVWGSAIEKLREIPTNKIVEKLRLSYELLEDDHDQNLFVHLSCFFVGMKKDFVVRILDKLRDMGRDIVRREAPVDPGKRTRLWHHTDSYSVLTGKTTLDISYSSSLESLPMGLRMIDSLEVLRADGIGPNQILCTTNESKSMQALFSSWILKPRISPEISWTFLPSSLVRLSLVSCSLSDGSFPEKFSNLPLLEELDLNCPSIVLVVGDDDIPIVAIEISKPGSRLLGLYEQGIFSTFLPGNKMPSCWFTKLENVNALSFTISQPLNNIQENIVHNTTKDLNKYWKHHPRVFGMAEGNEEITWLSHWKFGELLQDGDEISIFVRLNNLKVKELGINQARSMTSKS
ncbi:hypothetical protein FXO37_03874 [Capsicum annuum]|nr:hypothetical protein FXO37_03874 [Capsicum annuum]